MARRYAAETRVPVSRSQEEVRRLLDRYGADGCLIGEMDGKGFVGFKMQGRSIRFLVERPLRKQRQSEKAYEQAIRQRWRALVLLLKAKLEGVDSGIAVIDEEFLANIVVDGSETVYEKILAGQLNLGGGQLLALPPGVIDAEIVP